MNKLEEYEAIKLNDLCNLKSVQDLVSLETLLAEILSYRDIVFYAASQYGAPPIVEIDKNVVNQCLEILSVKKNIKCTQIYYDGLQKRYFPDHCLRLEDVSSEGISLEQIHFDRRQLEQVQLIPISEKYIIKPEFKIETFLWNGIEYFTFEQLKAIWDVCDYRTLGEVNNRLENKNFFAYSKDKNMLRKYEKKLPTWFKSHDYSMGDYTKRYTDADNLMFFERELQANEIFLPIRQEEPYERPDTGSTPLGEQEKTSINKEGALAIASYAYQNATEENKTMLHVGLLAIKSISLDNIVDELETLGESKVRTLKNKYVIHMRETYGIDMSQFFNKSKKARKKT